MNARGAGTRCPHGPKFYENLIEAKHEMFQLKRTLRAVVTAVSLGALSAPALAIDKAEVKALIEAAYPGARITEIEKETYRGKRIYEVDFEHDGKALEAIVSLDGEIIKVQIDD